MEVLIREMCTKCGGTAKNGMSRKAAQEQIDKIPPGGVLTPDFHGPLSNEERLFEYMKCGYCHEGYNERWVSLNELMSSGM